MCNVNKVSRPSTVKKYTSILLFSSRSVHFVRCWVVHCVIYQQFHPSIPKGLSLQMILTILFHHDSLHGFFEVFLQRLLQGFPLGFLLWFLLNSFRDFHKNLILDSYIIFLGIPQAQWIPSMISPGISPWGVLPGFFQRSFFFWISWWEHSQIFKGFLQRFLPDFLRELLPDFLQDFPQDFCVVSSVDSFQILLMDYYRDSFKGSSLDFKELTFL